MISLVLKEPLFDRVAEMRAVERPEPGKNGQGLAIDMLNADELERYARHIVLREIGGPGQAKLKQAGL